LTFTIAGGSNRNALKLRLCRAGKEGGKDGQGDARESVEG